MPKKVKFNPAAEGNRVARAINGYVKNGGPQFYTLKVQDATNPSQLRDVTKVTQALVDSDNVSFLLVACCERNVYLEVCVSPSALAQKAHKDTLWLLHVLLERKSMKIESSSAQTPGSTEQPAFKLSDELIAKSHAYLKSIGDVLEPDEEDDEENYAAQFEW